MPFTSRFDGPILYPAMGCTGCRRRGQLANLQELAIELYAADSIEPISVLPGNYVKGMKQSVFHETHQEIVC